MDAGVLSRTVTLESLSDRELLRLSRSRPRPILAWLSRSGALQPLLVPLLGLPLLWAGLYCGLTNEGAAWLLQWTSAISAEPLDAVLDPFGRPDAVNPAQPPLVDWLVRGGTRITGLPADQLLPTFWMLCTFGLLSSLCGLARGVGGGPVGLIAAAILVTDMRLPGLVRHTSPTSLALLLLMVSMRWMIDHQRKSAGIASWSLLASGCSLGGASLVNGPLALATAVVVGGATLVRMIRASWPERPPTSGNLAAQAPGDRPGLSPLGLSPLGSWQSRLWRQSLWQQVRRRAVPMGGSYLLWVLTAFAAAGWWWLMMSGRHGAAVWALDPWLANGLPVANDAEWWLEVPPSDRVLGGLGAVWLPLSVLGLIALARGFADRKLTAVARPFLFVWVTLGVVVWLTFSGWGLLSAMTADAWLLFARIPLAIIGAIGLWQACERRFPDPLTTAAIGSVAALACINALAVWKVGVSVPDGERLARWMGAGMAVGWLAGGIARHAMRGLERGRCLVWSLTLMLAWILTGSVTAGLIARPPANDREWTAWRRQIDRIEQVDRCILLASTKGGGRVPEPPLELLAHLRCRWPEVEITRTQSWTTAVSLVTRGAAEAVPQTTIIVAYGRNGLGQMPGTGLNLRPAGPGCYPPGWEVATFLAGTR